MSKVKTNSVESLVANQTPTLKDPNGREMGQPCKAWVNFDGTGTVAILDSFNVSSVTDVGTGDYQPNFTNDMSSTNYCTVVTAGGQTDGTCMERAGSKTTSSCGVVTYDTGAAALFDSGNVSVVVFAND